ncbi:hypothetical protein HPP92_028944 [Vanilla planifolia]|uniref:Secreted protein n=1 Tax=Vanilla planifolia TaxID=51239 RepID=A0A835P431_VANPL|nr:hypothetical protein HPP92_028934 [Vanilla planifolia]KAG0446241.1 hypothetical protein HPP92_028944 [Vanilla planifolia]
MLLAVVFVTALRSGLCFGGMSCAPSMVTASVWLDQHIHRLMAEGGRGIAGQMRSWCHQGGGGRGRRKREERQRDGARGS